MNDQMISSKVEFFHSQSSFGSSSIMSNSRVQDLAQQLLDDAESIFINLKSTLLPRQDLVQIQDVKHIVHRSKLLCKQTIPFNLSKLERQNSSNSFAQVHDSRRKLEKLISDYELYKTKDMNYQEFYDLYGRQANMNFSKKKNETYANINLAPDIVVEVVETHQGKNLKGVAKSNLATYREHHPRQRQVYELKDEICRLKKRQREILHEKQTQVSFVKAESEKRVSTILKMLKKKSQNQELEILRHNFAQTQQNLIQEKEKSENQRQKIFRLENQLQELVKKSAKLQKQTSDNRRIQLNNSRLSDANSHLNFEVHSEYELPKKNNVLKLEKIINNLNEQKALLKSELTRERQNVYRMQRNEKVDLQTQLYHTRKALDKKNKEISDLKKQLDKNKIQTIKVRDLYEKTEKQLNFNKLIVKSVQNTQKVTSQLIKKEPQILKPLNQNVLMVSRFSVDNFKGQSIEGNKYYELLNKQFKIRYRRSCLKQKQLLHKANGLQMGVISQFRPPNGIKIIAHLTDFGEEDIYNLKFKVINSNDNIVTFENQQIKVLKSGQQKKFPIYVQMKSYPLGATVLVCQYQFYDKKEQLRILLPAHIFKMMNVKPRDGQFRSPTKLQIKGQRKIVKDGHALQNYFKGCKVEDGTSKCTLMHEQTETKFLIDLTQRDGQIEIVYEHRVGEKKITQYFISTLKHLLQKEH